MAKRTNCENNKKCGMDCPDYRNCAGETAAQAVFGNDAMAMLNHNRGDYPNKG